MIKNTYEYRVEAVPTELVRVGTQDAWSIDRPKLEQLLNGLRYNNWVMQPESDIQPHGTIIFVKATRVNDDERIDQVFEKIHDLNLWREGLDPEFEEEVLRGMADDHVKRIIRAVLEVA